jgi:hypothetical protein
MVKSSGIVFETPYDRVTTLPFLQQRRGRRSKCIVSVKTRSETQKFRDRKNIAELRRNDPQQETSTAQANVPLSSHISHFPQSIAAPIRGRGAEKVVVLRGRGFRACPERSRMDAASGAKIKVFFFSHRGVFSGQNRLFQDPLQCPTYEAH